MLLAAGCSSAPCVTFSRRLPIDVCWIADAGQTVRGGIVTDSRDLVCTVRVDGGAVALEGSGTACDSSDTGGAPLSAMRCDLSQVPPGRYSTSLDRGAGFTVSFTVPLSPDAGLDPCP